MYEKFNLLPGAVPPFVGLLAIKGIVDSKFIKVGKMAFNAGMKAKSIVMDSICKLIN